MSYALFDNGDCIKFICDGQFFFLSKSSVTEIAVVREDVIKIGRDNCLSSIFFRHQDVASPFSYNAMMLAILLNSWVSNLPLGLPLG